MRRQYPPQGFAGLFTGTRLLSGQKECRFVGFPISREAALRRSEELAVVARVISRREVVEHGSPAVKNGGLTIIRASDVPHLSKERRLFPEVGSLHAAKEQIETVRMACAVVAGETVHVDAKEYPPDVRCDFIDPVESHQALVIVRIGPIGAPI